MKTELNSNILLANRFTVLQDDWVQISPLGDFPHSLGVQRVDFESIQRMARQFNSMRARLARRFGGLPFYLGHPDGEGMALTYPDRKAYGWIMHLDARGDGLYGQ